MIFEICAGLIVIASIVIILYLLTRSGGPVSLERRNEEGNVQLKLKANKDLRSVEVKSGEGEEELSFIRRDIRRDERIEFLIPAPAGKIKLTVTDESGTKTMSV